MSYDRFLARVARADEPGALEELALLAGAHIAGLALVDVDAFVRMYQSRLDALATACPVPTFAGIGQHLFADSGFRGNADDYYDPRNSYLHEVLERQLGIPITLSIVAMAVAHRLGVPTIGIGMPGHFLVGDAIDTGRFLDPFHGGGVLDRMQVERLFRGLHGPEGTFTDELLDPTPAAAIVARLLGNLKHIHAARGDAHALVRVLELRVLVPGVPETERRDLAGALTGIGRFPEAAAVLEDLAAAERSHGDENTATTTLAAARQIRARLN